MSSTGRFVLCTGFFSRLEVAAIVHGEPRGIAIIGAWMVMGTYHASYPAYDVPYSVRRLCGAKPRDVETLLKHGLLIDNPGSGWKLGFEGDLWSISYSRPGNRLPIPDHIRAAVFERDENACQHCGTDQDLTLDHIIPWSHGGPDSVDNLRLLCRSCNSKRGNRVEVKA